MNIIMFFMFAVPLWVFILIAASVLSDRLDRKRVEREHPGETRTPCGWRPNE